MPTENEECDFLTDAKIEALEKNTTDERGINTPVKLSKSEAVIGQLYPVLRDAEGKVIDGFHRLDSNPNWKSVILENIDTEEKRLIVSAHANVGRRSISRKERMNIINRLAEIYYQQGLRADAKIITTGINGRTQKRNYNEIKNKISEVMGGVMTPTQVKHYLLPKYLYQAVSEGNKRYHEKRRKETPAWELLIGSHGKQLRGVYGSNFFNRLEKEMLIKAKSILREDAVFINSVKRQFEKEMKDKIKDELEREIRLKLGLEIRASVIMDYGLMDEIPDWANKEKILEDIASMKRKHGNDKKNKMVEAYV